MPWNNTSCSLSFVLKIDSVFWDRPTAHNSSGINCESNVFGHAQIAIKYPSRLDIGDEFVLVVVLNSPHFPPLVINKLRNDRILHAVSYMFNIHRMDVVYPLNHIHCCCCIQ